MASLYNNPVFFYPVLGLCAAAAVYLLRAKLFKKKKPQLNNTQSRPTLDVVLISGPSGVGKGTLINKLMEAYPNAFAFSVSHTTRPPRQGETNGKEYHFVTREQFEKEAAEGKFLEYTEVHGNLYGTSKQALEVVRKSGRVAIVEVDVKGAQAIKKKEKDLLNMYFFFITAPSMEDLEKRIVGRGKDTPEKVKQRLETAKTELKFIDENPTLYNKILVNDDVDVTFNLMVKVLRLYGGL